MAAAPPPPPPLRLQPPAAAAGCRHEGASLPSPRPRSRAEGCAPVVPEQWRRLSRVHRPVTTLGLRLRPGRCQRPPAANRCRGRIFVGARRHSQGSGGGVRGWSCAKEDGWGRRQRPARPQRPSTRIRPRRRTRLDPAVGRQWSTVADPDARFLLLVPVPNFPCACSHHTPPPRLLASGPLRLRSRAHSTAATTASEGKGDCCEPPPVQKARGDRARAAGRKEEGPPLARPPPRLHLCHPPAGIAAPSARRPAWPAARLVAAAPPRQLECG